MIVVESLVSIILSVFKRALPEIVIRVGAAFWLVLSSVCSTSSILCFLWFLLLLMFGSAGFRFSLITLKLACSFAPLSADIVIGSPHLVDTLGSATNVPAGVQHCRFGSSGGSGPILNSKSIALLSSSSQWLDIALHGLFSTSSPLNMFSATDDLVLRFGLYQGMQCPSVV